MGENRAFSILNLNEAIRVAQVYLAEHGSFEGFGPDVASQYDPSIVYTPGTAVPDMVSMVVTPAAVVLVTVSSDGGYLCAAAAGDVVTFGRANATTPAITRPLRRGRPRVRCGKRAAIRGPTCGMSNGIAAARRTNGGSAGMIRRSSVPCSRLASVELPLTRTNAPSQPPRKSAFGHEKRATASRPAIGSHCTSRVLQNTSRR